MKFSEAYISDLNRTIQTASEILCYHKGVDVTFEKRLREKSGGILEGKPLITTQKLAKV